MNDLMKAKLDSEKKAQEHERERREDMKQNSVRDERSRRQKERLRKKKAKQIKTPTNVEVNNEPLQKDEEIEGTVETVTDIKGLENDAKVHEDEIRKDSKDLQETKAKVKDIDENLAKIKALYEKMNKKKGQ